MVKRSIPAPHNVLVSFYYGRDFNFDDYPDLAFIGDSGAFSAKSVGATITTKELADWALQWRHKIKWVAALDVIGNPVRTYSNWRDMVDTYGVKAIPTVHYGTHPFELDRYGNRGVDLVGLGGMGGRTPKQQMRWLITMFKYAQKHWPDMQFHGWGCTSTDHFRLPFYSVDSSSWTSSFRYGTVNLTHPATGKTIRYATNGREAFKPAIADLLTTYYGFNPRRVAISSKDTRKDIVKLSAMAVSAREQLFCSRHGDTQVPKWGVNPNTITTHTGPNGELREQRSIHLAESGGTFKWIQELHN